MTSQFIYIIKENEDVYPCAYTTYQDALSAVQEKNKELLEEPDASTAEEPLEGARLEGRYSTEFDSNLEENVETGITYLYIEYSKINIQIHRLPFRNK